MTRILVVDDKDENLYYLETLLSGHGCAVETARHGAEALVKARQRRPDLVVSDLLMPVMDGYTLLRHWRADPQLRDVPFVVYTATYTEAEDERLALDLGADAFLIKPAEPEAFLARIHEVRQRVAARPAARPEPADGDEAGLLEHYGRTLIRKLEEKTLQLEEANAALQRDIAERKRAEVELRRSEASKRAVWESSLDGIVTMDHTGRIVDWSPAAEQIFGHRRADAVGRLLAEMAIPPAYRERHTRGLGRYLATGEGSILGRRIEIPALRADGTEFPAELAVVAVHAGSEPLFIGTVRDVTERQRVLDRLREGEERFRELAETIQEVFWITDPAKERMLYVSPAYEKIWGRTCASLYASPGTWIEAIHPEDRARVARAARTRQVQGDYDETYRILRPDGTLRWIRDRAYPVHGPAGEVLRVVGTAEDVTDRRQLEQQFRQAHKMEAIGQLAAGVAHDFNNILPAILGNVELALADAGDAPRSREALEEIRKAGLRAQGLVQQILAFSRQQLPERRVVALGPIVEETVRFLRATIPSTVELVVSLDPGAPPVLADPTQIHQVIANLCTNAWHALGERPGRIEVELAAFEVGAGSTGELRALRPGPVACLAIRDDGIGMDLAILERIFDPFFTTKSPGKGTGLGLSVVHGIVQEHDGAIAVSSQPGQGTTFRVYLPAATAPAGQVEATKTPPRRGNGQHILYLDDEESLVLLAQRMLERLGYRLTGFTRAEDALRAFREDPDRFDLAVTDLNMPGASGLEVAAELRRLRPDLPLALCSGHVTEELRERAREAGIRQVIHKPNTMKEMAEAIHELVRETREGGSA